MTKINLNLENIRSRIFLDNIFYVGIKLNIGKIFFICSAFLYFLTYLFVVGGFRLDITAKLLFFIYPVFVFSTIAMLYEVVTFFLAIYVEKYIKFKYIFLVILAILYIFILIVHLGFKI